MFITKSTLWGILDADAITFATWLNGSDIEAVAMKTMLENTEGLSIDGPLIQDQLIPILLTKNIISQATADRFADYSKPPKRFAIPFTTAAEKTAILIGLPGACSMAYKLEHSPATVYVLTKGTCDVVGAEEV